MSKELASWWFTSDTTI